MTKFTRKILFTITSCLVCLGIAVGTLIAVLAQSNILVTTDVSVNYVSEINANGIANYWRVGDEKTEMLSDQKITSSTKTSPEKINVKLSLDNLYVVFEYIFKSNMTNLNAYAHLTYEDTGDKDKNVKMEVTTSDTQLSTTTEQTTTYQGVAVSTMPISNVPLNAGETIYLYVRTSVDDVKQDSELSGIFTWTLSVHEKTITAQDLPEDVQTISSDLTTLDSNKNYILLNDVTLNSTITVPNGYTGIIDGNGNTVTISETATATSYEETVVLTEKKSLFDTFSGTVQNLKVIGGSIINTVPTNTTATINNCTVEGNIVETGFENVAGASLRFSAGAFVRVNQGKLSINNSINRANVTGVKWVGGFVGIVNGETATISMDNCVNYGTIISTLAYGGGFVGRITGTAESSLIYDHIFSNLINNGTIKSDSSAGGLIGGTTGGTVQLLNCENTATVTSVFDETEGTSGTHSGGLIGYNTGLLLDINNCNNTGSVYARQSRAGGIIGSDEGYATNINNTHNKASVSADLQVGGIIGYNETETSIIKITNCSNKFKSINDYIYGKAAVGGIFGSLKACVTISNSYNEGIITQPQESGPNTSLNGLGGLIGFAGNTVKGLVIENCYNSGAIEGYHYEIGGLIGSINSTAGLYITQSFSSGVIKGTSKIGGLVGKLVVSPITRFTDCFAANEIIQLNSSSNDIAGIVGNRSGGDFVLKDCLSLNNFSSVQDNTVCYAFFGWGVGCKEYTDPKYIDSASGVPVINNFAGSVKLTADLAWEELTSKPWLVGTDGIFKTITELENVVTIQ